MDLANSFVARAIFGRSCARYAKRIAANLQAQRRSEPSSSPSTSECRIPRVVTARLLSLGSHCRTIGTFLVLSLSLSTSVMFCKTSPMALPCPNQHLKIHSLLKSSLKLAVSGDSIEKSKHVLNNHTSNLMFSKTDYTFFSSAAPASRSDVTIAWASPQALEDLPLHHRM